MTRRGAAVMVLSGILAAGLAVVPAAGPAAGPAAPCSTSLSLCYIDDGRTLRLRIDVELDGRPLDAVWDETFHRLFADLDRDGDGFLSRDEARRAPSALRVRQLSWGLFFAAPAAPPWEELDRDPTDGKVSFDEFADYYRRHGVGGVQVAVGRAPATEALTDALVRGLDRDGDGRVSKAEWQAAADSLHALDLNDDELISGDELVPGLHYPGAFGGTLLTPKTPDDPPSSLLDSFPFQRAPDRARSPNFVLTVRLGRRADGAAAVEWAGHAAGDAVLLDLAGARCALRAGDSRQTADFASARKLALARFAEADADHDGRLDRGEAERSTFAPLHDLFDAADRDGNGRVSAEEWSAYLDLENRLIEGQVVLTILDHGRGLFEFLDADRDGVLSVRELRSAWARLDAAGCLRDGTFDRSLLPRQLRCVVSRGRPSGARTPPTRGPAWFRAMDRNGDGDVSRREFLGSDAEFKRLDAHGDGLISADEAERAEAPAGRALERNYGGSLMFYRRRAAFALTELVVVLCLAAVLIGLLLPAVQIARQASPRVSCADNLRRIGQAIRSYADSHGGELPYSHRNKSPLSGWATLLLPHLGEDDLYKQYRFDLDWYDPAQQAIVSRPLKVMQCPAVPDPDRMLAGTINGARYSVPPADYAAVSGVTVDVVPAVFPPSYPRFGAMPVDETLHFSDILDGESCTLLVAEGAGRPQVWLAGKASGAVPPNDKSTWAAWNGNFIRGYSKDGKVMPGPCGVNCSNNNAVYGFHEGGANVLLGDGSVRFLKRDIDIYVLYGLATRAGGEIIANTDY